MSRYYRNERDDRYYDRKRHHDSDREDRPSKSSSRYKSRTPERRGGSRSQPQSRSPESSRSHHRSRSRSPESSRSRHRSRSRSPRYDRVKKEDYHSSRVKREDTYSQYTVKKEEPRGGEEYNYYGEERDYHYGYGIYESMLQGFTAEEKHSIRTLKCELCDIWQGDPNTMYKHLKGVRHIQARKVRGDVIAGAREHEVEDSKYWIKQDIRQRAEQAKVDPIHDDKRYNNIPAKFDKRNYRNGQYTKDLYCDICGVSVHSRDTMENHVQGAEHQRRATKHKKYECKICLVIVPCQNTLDQHFQGKDHIKRVNEIKKRKGLGYDNNAQAPDSLSNEEKAEKRELETTIKNLKRVLDPLKEKVQRCKHFHQDAAKLKGKVTELSEEVEYWKQKYYEELNKPKDIRTDHIKDEKKVIKDEKKVIKDEKKVKVELKPKKEEYREEQSDACEVIDID